MNQRQKYDQDYPAHGNEGHYNHSQQDYYQHQKQNMDRKMFYIGQYQPKRKEYSKEERESMFKHLNNPTQSLQLRQEMIKKQKEKDQALFFKNSRVLDNHYLRKVHSLPWIAPGIFHRQKYESDDTGIAITFPEHAYETKMNQDRQEVGKLTKEGFRNWNEYEKIRDNEYIITIEYCTNCHEHQGTTRHDEKKYEFIASNLKKEILRHYPMVKVYMKPLLTENQDHSIENLYARSRLGAMEVQMCTNREGKIEKKSIFSKLKTKSWPSTLYVLNQIRECLDKCTLTIELVHEFIDPYNLRDDQKRSSDNKLYNVEVILRPYRKLNQQTYTLSNSNYGHGQSQTLGDIERSQMFGSTQKSRPGSSMRRTNGRPMSAQSAYTVQSYSQLPQHEGYQPNGKSIEIREKSSPEGIVKFEKLPFDVYTIEIRETNDFRAYKNNLDIFKMIKEQQQKTISHKIMLEPVELTFAKIILDMQIPAGKDKGAAESVIRISQEDDEENELEGKIIKEFETTLEPGKYRIVIENPTFGRIERYHTFQFGNQELKISFDHNESQEGSQRKPAGHGNNRPGSAKQQQGKDKNDSLDDSQRKPAGHGNNRPGSARPQSGNNNSKKELFIQLFEAGNFANAIKDCQIKIKDEKRGKQAFQTNNEGQCVIKLDGYTKGIIKIKHNDFLTIKEEYGPTTMNINNMKELSFPLIRKPESDNEINLLMLTDSDKKIMTLNVIAPDGMPISSSKKDVIIENNQEQRSSLIKLLKVKETKGVYRIFAKVHDISLLTPSLVKLYVITSSKTMHFVEVPKSHPNFNKGTEIFWDIGAITVPDCKFIEINSAKTEPVTKDSYLPLLKQISDHLHKAQKNNKKGNDARSILGFPDNDPKVLQYSNDFFAHKEKIIESIVKNIFGGQNNPQLEHLINSALLTNGLYSFSKLKAKFESMRFPEGLDFVNDGSVKEVKEEEDEEYE